MAIVYIVDDDDAVRDSLRCLLESIDLDVACYASGREFLSVPEARCAGCVLLDLRIPDMSGLAIQRELAKQSCPKPVIFMSAHGEVAVSVRAMQQGAAEFLTKPVSAELLLDTVRQALTTSRQRLKDYQQHVTIRARMDMLSPRETEVLEGIFEGHSNKGIARIMGISPKTVELHRGNVMAKMHAGSIAELVRMYLAVRQADSRPG